MRLSEVPVGAEAIVEKVGESEISPRLRAIGILPGVSITVIRSAPMGDPRMYKVFNKIITLRQSEAELIEVKLQQESSLPLSYVAPGEYIVKELRAGIMARRFFEKCGIVENSKLLLLPDRRVKTPTGLYDIGLGKLSKIYVVPVKDYKMTESLQVEKRQECGK
ncbi:MAG: FeoA family protein [Fervidobacterium sp.]|uniref:Ferrous iron transport protein A n=1 Tax=Fervidobacterium gondwanense DSM 13020 TaxID=1121883 RepID=A0A1M7SAK5_FERGO|nr:FeoA family protein [Fervidobacterium gondwanense]UXF00408.1 iron transporter FeoA [Fervidobacterium riparium]SHN55617.1 ferrous iron transport protein A [Fervidobacterium gondwanense DSM 13020]